MSHALLIADSFTDSLAWLTGDEQKAVKTTAFLAALGGDRPNALFFSGDLDQRILQQPSSWKALGADVQGRSKALHT